MKVSNTGQAVERIGVMGETEFNIKSSAKAFDILSSGLYTDPIGAIVRELSCNAYDAHVDAGKKDTAFDIHLPTKLEPYFSVIDHGIGLSDENVRSLYSTYFESTKTQSNDVVGAFGLGSKSPFSYSKEFTVVSRFDKVKRTYSVFINEHGVPTMAEMSEVKTDESNGLEVKIAVRDEDRYTFANAVMEQLKYFEVKPNIVNNSGFEFETLKTDDYTIIDNQYIKEQGWRGEFTIVQGNVGYKVSRDKLRDYIESTEDEPLLSFYLEYTFILNFEIGDIDVAANREEIRYEPRTIDNIISKIKELHTKMAEHIDNELTTAIKDDKSVWNAFMYLNGSFRVSRFEDVFRNHNFKNPVVNKWIKGITFTGANSTHTYGAGNIPFNTEYKYHTIVPYSEGGRVRASRAQFAREMRKDPSVALISPSKHVRFIHVDIMRNRSQRINQLFSNGCYTVMAIVPKPDSQLKKEGINASKSAVTKEFKKIVAGFENPTIDTLSDVTTEPESVTKRKAQKFTYKKVRWSMSGRRGNKLQLVDVDDEPNEDDDKYYITVDHMRNVMINGNSRSILHATMKDAIRIMVKAINVSTGGKVDYRNVYALPKTTTKAIANDEKWKNLFTEYTEHHHALVDIREGIVRIGNSELVSYDLLGHRDFKKMVSDLETAGSALGVKLQSLADLRSSIEEHALTSHEMDWVHVANSLIGVGVSNDELDTTPLLSEKDLDEYPMLKYVSMNQYSITPDVAKEVKEYVLLVEAL